MTFKPLYTLALLLLFAQAVILSNGCSKSDRDEDLETLSASDYALAHHIFDDAFRQVHRYSMGDTILNDTSIEQIKYEACLSKKGTGLSDTLPIFPLTLSLNYADQGTPCYDQGLRYGILSAEFTGKYLNKGTIIEITFDGYFKDVYGVDGTITIINNGINSNGKRYYTMIIEDGLITGTNTNVTFNGTYQYVWVTGSSTETDFEDDVFDIVDGVMEGRNSRGSFFTNEITSYFVSDLSCAHFLQGRSDMNVQNLVPRTLNYGEASDCDNILISRRNNTYLDVEIPIMPLATF